jgi:hypothetical protein
MGKNRGIDVMSTVMSGFRREREKKEGEPQLRDSPLFFGSGGWI